jgi:hypothetical protein
VGWPPRHRRRRAGAGRQPRGWSRRDRGHDAEPVGEGRHLGVDRSERRGRAGTASDEDDVDARRPVDPHGRLAEQPLGPVPGHGVAHALRRHDRDAGRGGVVVRVPDVHDGEVPSAGPPSTQDGGDVSTVTQPVHGGRRHGDVRSVQAVSLARPRWRRDLTMLRPARVCIRARNPCLRARRRLLGWKVRFTTGPPEGWVDGRDGHTVGRGSPPVTLPGRAPRCVGRTTGTQRPGGARW